MDYSYYGTAHQAPIAFYNAPPQTYDIPDDPLPNGHDGLVSSPSECPLPKIVLTRLTERLPRHQRL